MALRAAGSVLLVVGILFGVSTILLVPFALMAESGGKNSNPLLALAYLAVPAAMVTLGGALTFRGPRVGRAPLTLAFRLSVGGACVALLSMLLSPAEGGEVAVVSALVAGAAFWVRATRPHPVAAPLETDGS